MDVRCEKCQTVYDFDDSKVTTAGVTVKCTQCGNLFKVRRRAITSTNPVVPASRPPSVAPSPPDAAAPNVPPERPRASTLPGGVQGPPITPSSPPSRYTPARGVSAIPPPPPTASTDDRSWLLRSPRSGEVRRFRELTTLQQWIVEKRVSRDDEISRSGESWKRLGGIAELASFFHVVDQADRRPSAQPPAAGGRAFAQPALAPHDAFAATAEMKAANYPAPARREGSMPLAPLGGPSAQVTAARPITTGPAFAETSPLETIPSHPPAGVGDDDDDDDRPARRGPRPGVVAVACSILVLVSVVGYLALFKREAVKNLFSGGEGRGAEAFRRGREYFLLDSDDSLRLADQSLQRAHGADEQNAQPVAALAEVNGVWASYLRDDAKSAEAAKQAGKADELRKLAQAHLDDSRRYAGEAQALAPDDPDVNRAVATFLLVDGAPTPQIEGHLRKCEDKHPDDAEASWVRGALALRDGKTTDARIALEAANRLNQAKTQHDLLRADYLIAGLALAQGRRDESRSFLDRMLVVNPTHDRARALLARLDAPPTPAIPVAADAGAAAIAPTAPAPSSPALTPPAASHDSKRSDHDSERDDPKGVEAQLARANDLLVKGRTKDAQKLFEKALAQRPAAVEGMIGLGYCYLDTEHFNAAIDQFKKVLSSSPKNGEAIIGLAEAYKMRGDKRRALEYYRRYLAEVPEGSKASMAQNNVAELGGDEKPKAPEIHDAPPIDKSEKSPSDPPP